MSKALIVSDNNILNQLYQINLEVYLATVVTLVASTQEAQGLFESGEVYDLVIVANIINEIDSATVVHQLFKKNKINFPLVIVGKPVKEIPKAVVVKNSYDLKKFLSSIAGILGITSKTMAALNVAEFYPLDMKFLMYLGEAPCSIFMEEKRNNEASSYLQAIKKGSQTLEFVRKLSSEGHASLFVNKLDRLAVVDQISKNLCNFIVNTKDMAVEEKSQSLEAGFEFVAAGFSKLAETTQEILMISNACTRVMEEVMGEVPSLSSLLELLKGHKNGYIYSHSMLVSYVSGHIVKRISWGGEGHIEKINFVIFFHDIVLAPIYLKYPELKYEEDLIFCDKLSDKEKEIVLNHARLSAELVLGYRKVPMGADLLIKQHHGMTTGVGFATTYKDDISPLAKVILISEAFIEEYMKGKDNDVNYQIDVKAIIKQLNEKFKKSTYKKIIEVLETIKI